MGKATDFKFGHYIHRVHPNKSPLKILEKRERGPIQGQPILKVFPIIPGSGKAAKFKFCTHIHRTDRSKSPLKISGKVAVGAVRDSRNFSVRLAHNRAHRAVIFAVAQLSCHTMLSFNLGAFLNYVHSVLPVSFVELLRSSRPYRTFVKNPAS